MGGKSRSNASLVAGLSGGAIRAGGGGIRFGQGTGTTECVAQPPSQTVSASVRTRQFRL